MIAKRFYKVKRCRGILRIPLLNYYNKKQFGGPDCFLLQLNIVEINSQIILCLFVYYLFYDVV